MSEALGRALVGGLAATAATAVGALPALALRVVSRRAEGLVLGFAAGAMLAASAFSPCRAQILDPAALRPLLHYRRFRRTGAPITRMPSAGVVRVLIAMSVALAAGCATPPPRQQDNLCAIFDQHPEWYDAAKDSQGKWGTPPHILMAFVKQESAFRDDAKPPRDWFLFIPLGRKSSAKGYAQAQDEAWEEYEDEVGGFFKSRSDMEDALDFIGWYNHKSNRQLGISKWDPNRLYLAYHEGHGGYARGTYKSKPDLLRTADLVDRQAREYGAQLRRCEQRFRCRHWYQVWPFCR